MAEVRSQSPQVTRASPAYGPGAAGAPRRPRRASLLLKHVLDRVTGAFILLVTAPLLVVAGLGLRHATGRALRRDERLGECGRTIIVRSLAITDDLRRRSALWRLVAGTGAGALPQLWSVVRGDMSVMGPRPRKPGFPPPPMRPGLTGPAQLELLDRWLSIADQFDRDQEYARTWSLALDARIAWRTLGSVVR